MTAVDRTQQRLCCQTVKIGDMCGSIIINYDNKCMNQSKVHKYVETFKGEQAVLWMNVLDRYRP
jgi:hypothetical protein